MILKESVFKSQKLAIGQFNIILKFNFPFHSFSEASVSQNKVYNKNITKFKTGLTVNLSFMTYANSSPKQFLIYGYHQQILPLTFFYLLMSKIICLLLTA